MSETTTEVTIIPASNTAVAPVEVDEDYKWLTDRLDAHERTMQEMQTKFLQVLEVQTQANQTAAEQSQTMIRALTEMVQSMAGSLTALAVSSTLQSNRNNSPEPETTPEPATVTEVPAAVVVPEEPAAVVPERQRLRRL